MLTTVPPQLSFLSPETNPLGPFGRAVDEQLVVTTMSTGAVQQNFEDMSISRQQIDDPSAFPMSAINHWTPSEATALIHALIASFSVILVSELGDKTFIITAIMAMKNSRSLVFISSVSALFLMTVLSVGMGVAVTVIPKVYTHYMSVILFLYFGLRMLKEAYDMKDESEESEFDEVKRSLEEESTKGANSEGEEQIVQEDLTTSSATKFETPTKSGLVASFIKTIYVAPIVIKVFTMILVAEWGDRSQISTVVLAAREDVVGVFVGSFGGHVLCTGLAVIGGRFIADMISVRTMTFLGGVIFLFFSTFAIITGES